MDGGGIMDRRGCCVEDAAYKLKQTMRRRSVLGGDPADLLVIADRICQVVN